MNRQATWDARRRTVGSRARVNGAPWRRVALAVVCASWAVPSFAGPYSAGSLVFDTRNQSMWSSGAGFEASDRVFLGAQWSDQRASIGGITGAVSGTPVPENPAWYAYQVCVGLRLPFCGAEPPRNDRVYVTDTRTGARVDLDTSGQFGLDFGYRISSGTVNASVDYAANLVLPDQDVQPFQFFGLNPTSAVNTGSITSQSPIVEARIDTVARFSGAISGTVCFALAGCAEGSSTLPTIDVTQGLVAIDPNSLKVLPDLLPGPTPSAPRQPLADVGILDQTLTLQAVLPSTLANPGFKLTTSRGPLIDTTQGVPGITLDLATVTARLPIIATSGGFDGSSIVASGRANFLEARLDLDALTLLSGTVPPAGVGITLVDVPPFSIGAQLDLFDIDAGPDVGLVQSFRLDTQLMVRFDFDKTVFFIDTVTDPNVPAFRPITSWEGRWSELPQFGLIDTTTFSPTFWIDATLTNTIDIDLGLVGTLDLLKFSLDASVGQVNLLQTDPISLNSLLGFGNQLFSTPKVTIPVHDLAFALGGFNALVGQPFTIRVAGRDDPRGVAAPTTTLIALLGSIALVQLRRRAATAKRVG